MELKSKRVLIINLNTMESETKTFPDMHKYIGGVGLGLKLLQAYYEKDPIIFSIGPLNGFFPYASKTSIVLNDGGVVEDLYIGGTLSTRLRFTGLDSIVILGKATEEISIDIINKEVRFQSATMVQPGSLGLPGKRSIIGFQDQKMLLDNYFTTKENFLEKKLMQKNITHLAVTGTEILNPMDYTKYNHIYNELLQRRNELSVKAAHNPSCSNCPMGCEKARVGELGGNVLVHSLVACQYAEKIYSDVGISFSCLNILGYDYTHEDLEALPVLVEKTLKELN